MQPVQRTLEATSCGLIGKIGQNVHFNSANSDYNAKLQIYKIFAIRGFEDRVDSLEAAILVKLCLCNSTLVHKTLLMKEKY
jgi:hypothetical protein